MARTTGLTRVELLVVSAILIVMFVFFGRFAYRRFAFEASLDEQVALVISLCDMAPMNAHGQKGADYLVLRNAWPNARFGAYYFPDAKDLQAMKQLTLDLELVVQESTPSSIRESIGAAYDLLATTGYNPEFVDRHRDDDLERLQTTLQKIGPPSASN